MDIENLEQVHTQLIEEEKIKTSDLPENIRKKVKGWNLLYGRLKNNPDDEKMFNSVQRQSISIADLIQDWLEKYNEEEDEEEVTTTASSSKETTDTESSSKETTDTESSSKETTDTESSSKETTEKKPITKKPFGNLVMEKKIVAILKENNGRIPVSQLQSIIGVKPKYPTQIVHSIKLQKIFLVSAYRRI